MLKPLGKTVLLLTLAVLLLAAPARAQEEQPDASDFVIGLNALNNQIKDSLAKQPSRRVTVVPFRGVDNDYPRVSSFLADQLVTALVSGGEFSVMDSAPLSQALDQANVSPLKLASTSQFIHLKPQYENASIVVGTITDLDSKVAVMARIIDGGSGQFTGGAMVYIRVSDEFAALLNDDRPRKQQPQQTETETGGQDAASVSTEKQDTSTQKPSEVPAEKASTASTEEKPVTVKETAIPEMTGESDVAIYNQARNYFKEKRFSAAITVFERLISRYPESPYADNAVYWIGESNYSMKRWEEARKQFQRVLDTYPYGNKVPDATFKRGFAEEKLGRLDDAIFSMEEVVRRFGKSQLADMAKAKLQQLRAAKQQQS